MAPRQSRTRLVSRTFLLDWRGFPALAERQGHLMYSIAGRGGMRRISVGVLLRVLTLEQMEESLTAQSRGGSEYQCLANFLLRTGW